MSVAPTRSRVSIPMSLKLALAAGAALLLASGVGAFLGLQPDRIGVPSLTRQAAPPVTTAVSPALATAATEVRIQDWLRAHPGDARAYTQLGDVYLQRARETGDPGYYARADAALQKALELDATDFEAMIARGSLALARHDFPEALAWAERARAINPYRAAIYGVIGDAQVEMGNYDAGFDAFQMMMDRRPDQASYARVSYARELMGDVDGAVDAMRRAIRLGAPTGENTAWCRVQLGNLYATYTGDTGDLAAAEAEYRRALAGYPEYVHARGGLGRVAAARGEFHAAIAIYEPLVAAMPLPEFIITLGDLYTVTGRTEDATQQYELVRVVQGLNRANGVDVDLELALFDADHDHDLPGALGRARGQMAHRPSVKSADVLAWTLYKSGQYSEARAVSEQALRLGTRDPLIAFHAGMIAHRLGEPDRARGLLRRAVEANPGFSLLYYAGEARAILAELDAEH